MYNVIPRLLKF